MRTIHERKNEKKLLSGLLLATIIDYQADGSINTWTSFHGYHVRNYFATNEHFGDLNQFRELRDALHENGFSCILSILVGISEIKNR